MTYTIFRFENVSKHFGGVQALKDVNFQVKEGEIHGLVGENGAGKSTLVKICSGVHKEDGGQVYYRGDPVEIDSTRYAEEELGISVVHQEIPLCPNLTVAQNVFLGPELEESRYGVFPNWERMQKRTRKLLSELDIEEIDPSKKLEQYSVAERQLVAIAQAINRDAEILILDEPTSSLPSKETRNLLELLEELQHQGYTIIYISHKLEEVFSITDTVTVLRNGLHVGTKGTSELDMDEVVEMMVGEEKLRETTEKGEVQFGGTVLEVEGLTQDEGLLEDISFELREGEVLGFAGIKGAGRTELALSIFGYSDYDSGTIRFKDRELEIDSPRQALNLGIGYLPEDRTRLGLFFKMSVQENIATTTIDGLSSLGMINRDQMRELGEKYVGGLDIATPDLKTTISNLSGGNQQKVLLSRWLAATPKVLILDEPTRALTSGQKQKLGI
ncbi:MAG: sugar ABC transporter ATP-binding protein [Candidatus Acetothermia bacterium]